MPLDPCGLAVDVTRTCGIHRVRFFLDSDAFSVIRYYRVPAGTPFLPIPSRFSDPTHCADSEDRDDDVPGVVGVERNYTYDKGARPAYWAPRAGQYCGDPTQWLNGCLTSDPDPVWLPWGISLCCLRKLGFPRILAAGGDADGGAAQLAVKQGQEATGGDADGGSGILTSTWKLRATGGDVDDGAAPPTPNVDLLAAGGDADGGSARIDRGYDLHAAGGDTDLGAGSYQVAYTLSGAGGDKDDGTKGVPYIGTEAGDTLATETGDDLLLEE